MYPNEKNTLEKVLSSYPVNVLEIKNESYKDKKGVWWINTETGMLILKKMSNSEDTILYLLDAIKYLSKKGVNLPRIIKTKDAFDFAKLDNVCYILTRAIEGKNPSYSIPEEMVLITRALAGFHKASEGFFPAQGTKPKYHLGIWPEDYKEQLEDIKKFYEIEIQQKQNNAAGKTIISNFPYFYERAQQALEGLNGKEYFDWVSKVERKGCLCHQDFAAGNLILNPKEGIYILDTDSITIDIPARDIRKLLNKVLKKSGKWDLSLTRNILYNYQTVNPLSPSEWIVLKYDLMFPHLFLGAANKYYYKRDKEWSEDKYHQRIYEMSAFEKTIQPVLDSFDSIIPV